MGVGRGGLRGVGRDKQPLEDKEGGGPYAVLSGREAVRRGRHH